jgi:hypothetical protein
MKDIRDAMVEILSESKKFRISDEVHMTEVQVLSRLKRDGLIDWFDSSGKKSFPFSLSGYLVHTQTNEKKIYLA